MAAISRVGGVCGAGPVGAGLGSHIRQAALRTAHMLPWGETGAETVLGVDLHEVGGAEVALGRQRAAAVTALNDDCVAGAVGGRRRNARGQGAIGAADPFSGDECGAEVFARVIDFQLALTDSTLVGHGPATVASLNRCRRALVAGDEARRELQPSRVCCSVGQNRRLKNGGRSQSDGHEMLAALGSGHAPSVSP